MAGLWTRPRVRSVAATSSTFESRPYCAAITSYPSACSGGMTLLKHEPSAQIPWQNTMLGLTCGAIAPLSRAGELLTARPQARSGEPPTPPFTQDEPASRGGWGRIRRAGQRIQFGGHVGGFGRAGPLEDRQRVPELVLGVGGEAFGPGAPAQAGQRVRLLEGDAGPAGQVQG